LHKLFIAIVLSCCCINAFAQQQRDSTERGTNYSLAFEPLFVFINCFKTDIAVKPIGSSFGIELTPEVYATERIIKHPGDKVSGYGIGLYGKIYLTHDKHPAMLSIGATYRDINIRYKDIGFIPYQQNGLDYYRYTDFTDVLKMKSTLVDLKLSDRLVNVDDAFFLDVYLGFGCKFSSSTSKYAGFRSEDKDVLDYGYNGPTVVAGVKLVINYKHVKPK